MSLPAPANRFQNRRCGLSVVELLAATVISLIVMGATVQLFGTVGAQITNGRSNIEASDRLRNTLERLRKDLRGETVDLRTWNTPEQASGYFEIIKGPPKAGGLGFWDQNATTLFNGSSTTPQPNPLLGYTMDGLFFTTRSRDVPFVGRVLLNGTGGSPPTPSTVESQVAEVAWYLEPNYLPSASPGIPQANSQTGLPIWATTPPTFTLYRRVLLVLPGVGTTVATGSPASIPAYASKSNPSANYYFDSTSQNTSIGYPGTQQCDLSAHFDGNSINPNMILNSLADLAYRENRFGHNSLAPPYSSSRPLPFPYLIQYGQVVPFPSPQQFAADPNLRYGEDVVLSNVLSFDVKVWDPGAPVLTDSSNPAVPGNPLVPSDVGYSAAYSKGQKIGTNGVYGAYVDLNWGSLYNQTATNNPSGVPQSYFIGPSYGSGQYSTNLIGNASLGAPRTPVFPTSGSSTYDTWSAGYETWNSNSLGTNQSYGQASDGFYEGGSGGVDGPAERLTSPPYPVPLRGIQIKIRTYEFTSKQVREATIQENFAPD
jgi:hypothetical protein